MIGKEGLIEGHLAIALIVVHAMQRHSRADGGNGIAGEIARRHREHHEVVECEAVSLQTGQRERAGRQIKLVHTHAGKRLVHQLAIVLNSIELLANKGHQCRIGNGSLDHIFIQKRRARRRVYIHRLSQQLLHIEHLGTGIAQNAREDVMLLLGVFQIEGIVNPAFFKLGCLHIGKLASRSVQHDALQVSNFARNVNGLVRHLSLLSLP